jgi:hypothetical protein
MLRPRTAHEPIQFVTVIRSEETMGKIVLGAVITCLGLILAASVYIISL